MIHQMKLNHNAWTQISSGRKTAEIRLNDAKRRQIKLGDEIHFTDLDDNSVLSTKVVGLSLASTFAQLFSFVDPYLGGWDANTKPEIAAKAMGKYYPESEEQSNGVVAIHVTVLDPIQG